MEHKTFLCWAVTLSIDRLPESRSGSGILQVPDQMFIQKKKKKKRHQQQQFITR